MRTETRTVRIGENMGPIDWTYDFRSHFNNYGCSDAGRGESCERAKARLRLIEEHFREKKKVFATNYGGSPRCGIHLVVDIGMYDGWPWWRPVPAVQVRTYLGHEWYTFDGITDIYSEEQGLHTAIRV